MTCFRSDLVMEKKQSVTSQFGSSCNMYVSPVKRFDTTDETKSRKDHLDRNRKFSNLKVEELESTITKQQAEIRQLKKDILMKDDEYKKTSLILESALELLDDISQGNIDHERVNNILKVDFKKRKERPEDESQLNLSKKRRDDRILSFNEADSDFNSRKRKKDDFDLILKQPSKYESARELDLDIKDKKIKIDSDKNKAVEKQWEIKENRKLREENLAENEKNHAYDLKMKLRNNLSDSDLMKRTKEKFQWLHNISCGEVESPNHKLYFDKCAGKSQSLLYTSTYEPFSDHQADIVHALVSDEFKEIPGIESNYLRDTNHIVYKLFHN